ncbi:MAG: transcription initiation factor IIB family protein [Thermoplasmata archaeon]
MDEQIIRKHTLVEESVCPECGSTHLEMDYVRSEVVCSDCGLVVDENIIDHGQEWTSYSQEDWASHSRTGPPMSYLVHDKGLSTDIPEANVDAQRRRLSMKTKQRFYRMRLLHNRVRAGIPGGRGLIEALRELDRISSSLGLPPSFKEEAAMIYRRAREEGLVQGRSIRAVMGASVYAVCRLYDVPRTFDEIAKAAGVGAKSVKRAYNAVSRKLGLTPQLTRPRDYLERFASRLGLSRSVRARALEYLDAVPELDVVSGKSPLGTVAAAIYMAAAEAGEHVTQRKISQTAGVSEVTLRARCKEIEMELQKARKKE